MYRTNKGLVQILSVFGLLATLTLASGAGPQSTPVRDATPGAAEYVYLHQTRNGASALQKVSDRSRLQCVAD